MAKVKWEDTPFRTLKMARVMAERMKLCPGAIQVSSDSKFRFFQFAEGRKVVTIAQSVNGGPVREKADSKGKRITKPSKYPPIPRKNLLASEWARMPECKTLEEAEAKYRSAFLNPENLEVIRIIMFRDGEEEREYALDSDGVWARVLHRQNFHTN